MENVKEKAFGFVVVAALGVIFVPMLFNESHQQMSTLTQELPAPPEVKLKPMIPPPELSQNSRSVLSKEPAAKELIVEQKTTPETQEIVEKQVDLKENTQEPPIVVAKHEEVVKKKMQHDHPAQAQTGWVVQVGTFAFPEHAKELVNQLKAAGYPAFSRASHRPGRVLTLVLVGPHVRKEEIAKLKSTLAAKYNLQGNVVRYEAIASR